MTSVVAERLSADYHVSHGPSRVCSSPNILKQVLEQQKTFLLKGVPHFIFNDTVIFFFLNLFLFLKKLVNPILKSYWTYTTPEWRSLELLQ